MSHLPRRYQAKLYPGLFKRRYVNLSFASVDTDLVSVTPPGAEVFKGRDWLRRIDPQDRRAFADLGNQCSERGKLGGRVRASKAKRDKRGRFAKND